VRAAHATVARLRVLVFVAALFPGGAFTQAYPSKPIQIVVPWPPGSASDQRMRQVAERLTRAVGQPVVVDNKPGASGAIGVSLAAKARPDGYTLLWGTGYDLAINPAINPKLTYNALRDFAPITQAVFSYLVLTARPGLRVRSLDELIALAKASPGQLTCGSSGNATNPHFALEVLKRSAGVDLVHVPYKGEPPLLNDLLGGHLDLAFVISTTVLPHVKAGKLVPLAVTSSKRLAVLPDVATAIEIGYPELQIRNWGGLLAPAGTPAPVIQRLNVELVKIIDSLEIREQWANGGAEAAPSSPEEFAAFIRLEQARWSKLAKQIGMKVE
jgi:tripartite-type tricarboxylate transporter receptor subunit TctC